MNGVVIIPAYNPDEKLIDVVKKIWLLEYEIIVVDDGSGDETQKYFEEIRDMAIILGHEENQGKGAAIKTALRYIQRELWDVDVVGVMDADGQHLPEDMERLLAHARHSPMTLTLGVRNVGKQMPLKSRLGNLITRTIFALISGKKISDTQTGLRAFDKGLIPQLLQVPGERYEYETNALLALVREGVAVEEVQIQTVYHDKENSCSHFRAVQDSFRIYKDITKFALSSLSSFFLDYALFVTFSLLCHGMAAGAMIANTGARMVSGYYNYHINAKYVFHEKEDMLKGLEYFILACVILAGNNIILTFYHISFGMPLYMAKLTTEMTLFLLSFLIQNKVIYRKGRLTPRVTGGRHIAHII